MKILMKYSQRLGDIIRVLAMARTLSERGHEVEIECKTEYHSIFPLCPYAIARAPGQSPYRDHEYGLILEMEIWPRLLDDYRKSGDKWWDFVTERNHITAWLKWRNPFSIVPESPLPNPKSLLLIADIGFSQTPTINPVLVSDLAKKLYPKLTPLRLGLDWKANHLTELVGLVAHAGEVVTINTSITYIADAVREKYDHIPERGHYGQDDFFSKKQIRHKL